MVGAIQEILLPGELISDDGLINLEAEETVAISGVDSYHKNRTAEMQGGLHPGA